MTKDYYKVLGVSKSASQDEIKSAFKKLAIKYHPDKHQDKKEEMNKKFQEISEAYDTLGDEKKRANYDRFGSESPFGNGGGENQGFGGFEFNMDINDIFSEFFGGSGSRSSRRGDGRIDGSDLKYNLQIDLLTAYNGKDETIRFTAMTSCGDCKGSGSLDGKTTNCSACDGHGSVRYSKGFIVMEEACKKCNGAGKVAQNPCKSCNGQGAKNSERIVKVKIPAGIVNGSNIKIDGQGEPGRKGGRNGDLYVAISIKNHEIFTRKDDNLYLNLVIKMSTATLGGEVIVPTIDGKGTKLTIPSGTQNGTELRVNNAGMKSLNSTRIGQLFVKITVETPVKLNEEQKELIRKFDELSTGNHPECDSIMNKIKRFFS